MKISKKLLSLIILFYSFSCFNYALAETPVNCSYDEIKGLWIFHEGPRGNEKTINCSEADCNLYQTFD